MSHLYIYIQQKMLIHNNYKIFFKYSTRKILENLC